MKQSAMKHFALPQALALAASIGAATVPSAQAATLQYTLTGTDTDGTVEFASFQIDSMPAILPANVGPGEGFRVKFIPGTFQYGSIIFDLRDIQFFNAAVGGGFIDLDPADKSGGSSILNALGPQLYSGPESSPTLLTGRFDLSDAISGAPLTLNVTAVPEPATWMMLVIGFGAAGVVMRRRNRARLVPAAA